MVSLVEDTLGLHSPQGQVAHYSQTGPFLLLNLKLPGGRGLMKPPPASL